MLRPSRSLARLTTLSAFLLAVPMAARLSAQTVASDAGQNVTRDTVSIPVAPMVDQQAPVPAEQLAPAARGGAPLTGLRSAAHSRDVQRAFVPNAAATHANLGQARAMIVVGAAALITGAIIGDAPGTIIMVGGAVIGLYGLYQYLQ